jgi:hypothetical protein
MVCPMAVYTDLNDLVGKALEATLVQSPLVESHDCARGDRIVEFAWRRDSGASRIRGKYT